MNTNIDDKTRELLAICTMVAVGGVLVAVVGEVAKYVMPHEALYFLLVNKVYILAAAVFLLMLGMNRISSTSVRNMIAAFVLTLIGLVVLWQLDGIFSGLLWNGLYPTVYGRIPERAVSLFMQSIDVIGLVLGALGAFMVLLKLLDYARDQLTGPSKKTQ